MALKKRSGYWVADMRDLGGGRRRLGKVGEVSEQRVRQEYNQIEGVCLAGDLEIKQGHTLAETFLHAMRVHWKGMKYEREVDLHWRDIRQYLPVELDVNKALTTEHVDTLKGRLIERGLSPKTINRKLAVVSKLAHLASEWGWLRTLPKIKRMKEGAGRVRWYTDEEVNEILRWFRANNLGPLAYATLFMVDTGWRVSEVLGLKPGDLGQGVAYLWDQKSGKRTATPLTYRASSSAGRLTTTHRLGMTVHQFDKAWRKMAEATGIEGTPHACRHTCAMRLAQRGVDVVTIREFMRHSDVRTTMIYLHLAGGALRGAADALEKPGINPDRSNTGGEEVGVPY